MSQTTVNQEFWSVFNARRVKAPDLRGPDAAVSSIVGWFENHKRMLARLKRQAARVERLEKEIHNLSAARFKEAAEECRDLARVKKLTGPALDRAMAVVREGCFRAIEKRPFPVQIMGALAMINGYVSEMASGEGKTMTASLGASILGWGGKPVRIITVQDYLGARGREEMGRDYK